MTFDWYKIINKDEFEASGLVSKEVEAVLDGIGEKTILVTRGNLISLVVDGIMISVGLGGANPFVFGGYGVYLDSNSDIWLGVPVS